MLHPLRAALVPLLLLAAGCIGPRLNERAFHPREGFELLPEDLGLSPETVVVAGADGALLHGWRFAAAGGPERHGDTVALFGGNADNKQLLLPLARALCARGFDVVAFDWRGFGLSTGSPDLDLLVPDAVRALSAVRADPRTRRLAVYGVSLGSPVALGAAARTAVDAVVVESLLVPRHALRAEVGGLLAFLAGWLVIPAGFDVAAAARDLSVPVLFMHGAEDDLTPLAPAAEVIAGGRGAPAPREAWIAADAGHAPGIAGVYGELLVDRMTRFLDEVLAGAPAPALEVEARSADGTARVRLRDPRAPRPFELALVQRGAPARFTRGFTAPGDGLELELPLEGQLVAALADVPVGEVRALPDGSWERVDPALAARRGAGALEREAYESLAAGLFLRVADTRVFFLFDEPLEPAQLAAACDALEARLAAGEGPDLPFDLAALHAELWALLARRRLELGQPEAARAALARGFAVLPAAPFAAFRFHDSGWTLGVDLGGLLSVLDDLVEADPDPERAARDRARLEAWRAQVAARAAREAEWLAAQRAERDRAAAAVP